MIPKKFHFVYLTKEDSDNIMYKEFHLVHYLCIKSAYEVNSPDEINLYCNKEPKGEWWDKIKNIVNVIFVEPPTEIFGKQITQLAHQSDVIRLQALLENGGIYADMDTIFVKPLDDLLDNKFVLGEQGENGIEGICPAMILSEKDSTFGKEWLMGFNGYFRGGAPGTDGWCTHSVYYPKLLSEKLRDDIHVEPHTSFFWPMYHQDGIRNLFVESHNFNKAYSHHLWETVSKEYLNSLTVDKIMNENTTFNLIARKHL